MPNFFLRIGFSFPVLGLLRPLLCWPEPSSGWEVSGVSSPVPTRTSFLKQSDVCLELTNKPMIALSVHSWPLLLIMWVGTWRLVHNCDASKHQRISTLEKWSGISRFVRLTLSVHFWRLLLIMWAGMWELLHNCEMANQKRILPLEQQRKG